MAHQLLLIKNFVSVYVNLYSIGLAFCLHSHANKLKLAVFLILYDNQS